MEFVLLLMTVFTSTSTAQTCGSTFRAFPYSQTFTSPNYPANYPNNLNCNWMITAPEGYAVKVTFNPFFTESCCDYVQVFDGSASMGQYRGRKADLVVTSTTNSMRIVLHSDDSINGLGFSAVYVQEDVDECAKRLHNCGSNSECHNAQGTFSCTCKLGYAGNGTHCTEINECENPINPPNCHVNAHCNNLIGTYSCECDPGYAGDGIYCIDVDECSSDLHTCDDHVTCTNYNGGYTCTCNPGFTGDGRTCTDIDECEEGKHNCVSQSACDNRPGHFACVCPSGFTGDGAYCVDVNECAIRPPVCDSNAQCINSEGGYRCACAKGFAGDGRTCRKAFDVRCLPGSISVRVVARYYTDKGIDVSQVHFSDFSCKGSVDPHEAGIWIFNLTTLSSCSTIQFTNATHLMYTNTLSNILEGNRVYVGSAQINTFTCSYKKTLDDLSLFSLNYGVYQDIANITAPSNLGVFIARMNHFTDATYSTPQTQKEYETTDTIFVMIELDTTDPSLNLVIDRCWITPSPNVSHRDLFTFINNGCAVNNSADILVTQSGIGHVARFQSKVFAFIDFNTTYLHCSLLICTSYRGQSCESACIGGKNRNIHSSMHDESVHFSVKSITKRHKRSNKEGEEILSIGPFHVIRDTTFSLIQSLTVTILMAVLAVVFFVSSVFLVVILLRQKNENNPRTIAEQVFSVTPPVSSPKP